MFWKERVSGVLEKFFGEEEGFKTARGFVKEVLDNGIVQEGEFVGQFIGMYEGCSRVRCGVQFD